MTGIQTVPGMDYVSHNEIMPYTSCEDKPVHNDLFNTFFSTNESNSYLQGTEKLVMWKKNNYKSLKLNKVLKCVLIVFKKFDITLCY